MAEKHFAVVVNEKELRELIDLGFNRYFEVTKGPFSIDADVLEKKSVSWLSLGDEIEDMLAMHSIIFIRDLLKMTETEVIGLLGLSVKQSERLIERIKSFGLSFKTV